MSFKFSAASESVLVKAHPDLQRLMRAAIKVVDFKVLDASRGRAAQTKAFLTGHSKAKFGQSAHNWMPSLALDLFPAPYIWPDDKTKTAAERKAAAAAFKSLYAVIGRYNPKTGKGKGLALQMKIPLRCGIDWNMDDDATTSDAWDGGHYELYPWQDFAKKAHLIED